MTLGRTVTGSLFCLALGWPSVAVAEDTAFAPEEGRVVRFPTHADEGKAQPEVHAELPRDAKHDVPIVAYAYSARGAAAKSVGAYAYGLALASSGQGSTLGGGATVWGSPVDHLTLIADASRDASGRFTPSVAAMGRLLGDREHGFSLGVLGKWKAEGFGVGPHGDEIESELEGGLLLTLAAERFHFDANTLGGGALGGSGEADIETRLRTGYDVGRRIRLGLDGQARLRVSGPKYLPNGRVWDFAAGSQIIVGDQRFFGAFTVGPSTMGVLTDAVGVAGILTLGGTT